MSYYPLNPNGQATMANSEPVVIASDQSAVPVSAASLPLPSGASTAAKQDTGNTSVASIDTKTPALGQALAAASVPVVLTAAQVTTLTPPAAITGFATAAKQPALGTAGTPSTDVLSVQGITSMTPLKVDGSGVTQPVSGTFWQATQPVSGTFWQATQPVSLASVPSHAVTNAGTFAIQDSEKLADNAAFTDGTTKLMPVGYIYDEVAGTALTENDIGAARMNANRALVGAIEDGATRARYATVTAANALKVDGSAVTQPTSAASGSIASGAIASGAIASGAIASGAIAAGAIAAGATSIAANEDDASAGGDRLVKVAQIRLDTPVSGANVSASGDYTQFIADSFGKTWVTATVPEDTAHVAGEPIGQLGARRIDPLATSSGSDGDWSTVNQSAEGALYVTSSPTTASGLSVANFNSGDSFTALTNTAQVIKASAGNLYGYYIYNPNATATYVMIYNVAAASVTVGTTNPLMVFCIPATAGANLSLQYPITFSNAGWSIAAATTGGGSTAPATALEAMIFYK